MAGEVETLIEKWAPQFGVPVALAVAQQRAEDASQKPDAVSPAGAIGLFQVEPVTALDVLENNRSILKAILSVAEVSVILGTFYDSQLKAQVSQWFQGEDALKATMAAYNCGAGRLHQAITQCRASGADEKVFSNVRNYLPAETQHYVDEIWAEFVQATNPQA